MHIIVFGDSITYGSYDTKGGWVERLREDLDKLSVKNPKLYYATYNLGVDADTTSDLIQRFESEIEVRIRNSPGEEVVVIFQIGGNDASYIKKWERNMISKDRFRENIERLIEGTRKFSKKIIFLGLLPVNEKLTSPFDTDLDGTFYRKDYAMDYSSILRVICEKQKVLFINLFEEFEKLDYIKLLDDGLHPNKEGHKLIFEIVKKQLTKNKVL